MPEMKMLEWPKGCESPLGGYKLRQQRQLGDTECEG